MKLIDLLVQELPKRGGWPEGVNEIGQDYDGELMFYGRGNARTRIYLPLSSDHRDICCRNGDKVTKDRYESALAASQKSSWNGKVFRRPGVNARLDFVAMILSGFSFAALVLIVEWHLVGQVKRLSPLIKEVMNSDRFAQKQKGSVMQQ